MQRYIDKLLLLAAALLLFSMQYGFIPAVIPLLAAMICTLASSVLARETFSAAIFALYAAACFFHPPLALFLGLLVYDFSSPKTFFLTLLTIPVLFLFTGWEIPAGILITEGFTVLLSLRERTTEKLQRNYYSYQDIAKENNLLLERKNRELREQQYYRLQMAKLEERNRIAREIHDSVGHVLTSSILQTGALIATVQDESVKNSLILLKNSLTSGMNSIRKSVHDLHEEVFDLEGEIDKLVKDFTFCPVTFSYRAETLLKKDYCLIFITCIKECLNNIAKHSNATEARVLIKEHPSLYQLIVQDNGTNYAADAKPGLGLTGMRERVEKQNGTFSLVTGNGYKIIITLPRENRI